MIIKEVKRILKDYKDFLNKEHKGMYCKISDYSLDKYIKEQLTLTKVGCSKRKEKAISLEFKLREQFESECIEGTYKQDLYTKEEKQVIVNKHKRNKN